MTCLDCGDAVSSGRRCGVCVRLSAAPAKARTRYRKQCPVCRQAFWTVHKRQTACSRECGTRHSYVAKPRAPYGEKAHRIEAAYAAARAARLARERATGRRTFQHDPWTQRPGAGEWNVNADTQGEGWS